MRGVAHAALFGSAARGEETADRDVEVLVKLAPDNIPDAFQYAGLTLYIEGPFPQPVDVVDPDVLKPSLRARAEAICAF